jgi:hypothetical protein
MVLVGKVLWVENPNSISEIDISSGKLLRTLTDPNLFSYGNEEMIAAGSTVWIGNALDRVIEISAMSGKVLKVDG